MHNKTGWFGWRKSTNTAGSNAEASCWLWCEHHTPHRSGPKQCITQAVWHASYLAANCSIVCEIKKGDEARVWGTLPLCVIKHKGVWAAQPARGSGYDHTQLTQLEPGILWKCKLEREDAWWWFNPSIQHGSWMKKTPSCSIFCSFSFMFRIVHCLATVRCQDCTALPGRQPLISSRFLSPLLIHSCDSRCSTRRITVFQPPAEPLCADSDWQPVPVTWQTIRRFHSTRNKLLPRHVTDSPPCVTQHGPIKTLFSGGVVFTRHKRINRSQFTSAAVTLSVKFKTSTKQSWLQTPALVLMSSCLVCRISHTLIQQRKIKSTDGL